MRQKLIDQLDRDFPSWWHVFAQQDNIAYLANPATRDREIRSIKNYGAEFAERVLHSAYCAGIVKVP